MVNVQNKTTKKDTSIKTRERHLWHKIVLQKLGISFTVYLQVSDLINENQENQHQLLILSHVSFNSYLPSQGL